MSEFKGTPGPWGRWEQGGLAICKDIGNGDLREIAYVEDCATICEEEANADLIAAAPELLYALQALLQAVRPDETGEVCLSDLEAVEDEARAAVFKALGRA